MFRGFRGQFVAIFLTAVVALALTASPGRVDAYATEVVNATPKPEYNALTRLAMTALRTQQGECFPWMRRVVQAATGIVVGTDYRLGYLNAGLTEVPLAQARNGDIIQVANDANTVPTADYAGLHTAFILEPEGGGNFRVVDANSNYDGIVRVRTGYNPAERAAAYPGLSFHIYRLPGSTPGGAVITPPASLVNTPGILPIGSAAEIAADGDCLRVRSIAGLSGAVMGCLPTGARVTVTQPGPDVDGYHWVTITNGVITGWASERYLRAASGPGPAIPQTVSNPTPPSARGRIVSGVIPTTGMGLVVWGGGTEAQLLAASGCPADTASFWATSAGNWVQLLPGVSVPVVNAAWHTAFPGDIPANLALMASCRPETGLSAAPFPGFPSAATSGAQTLAAVPTPAPRPATSSAVATSAGSSSAGSTYTVVPGDSLYAIADRLSGPGTSTSAFLAALYAANGLSETSVITAGQSLRLPTGTIAPAPAPSAPAASRTPSTSGSTYTVAPGDTLSSIAEQFHGASVSFGIYLDLLRFANGLTDASSIMVGQVLRLPGATGSAPASSAPASTARAVAPGSPSTYTVSPGDTLSSIAEQFHAAGTPLGTYLDMLCAINGMTQDSPILVGKVLTLPR